MIPHLSPNPACPQAGFSDRARDAGLMPLQALTINGYSAILYLYGDNLTTSYL